MKKVLSFYFAALVYLLLMIPDVSHADYGFGFWALYSDYANCPANIYNGTCECPNNLGPYVIYMACTVKCNFSFVQCSPPLLNPDAQIVDTACLYTEAQNPDYLVYDGLIPWSTNCPPQQCPQIGSDPMIIPSQFMTHDFELFHSPSVGKLNMDVKVTYNGWSTTSGTGNVIGLTGDAYVRVIPLRYSQTFTTTMGVLYILVEAGNLKAMVLTPDHSSPVQSPNMNLFVRTHGVFFSGSAGLQYTDETGITKWFNLAGQITAETDGTDAAKYYNYDSYGRLSNITDSTGRTIQYGYPNQTSSLVSSVIDPNGNVYYLYYNTNNQINQITYPDGTNQQMIYSTTGQLLTLTDQAGNRATYKYNNTTKTLSSFNGPYGLGSFTVTSLGSGSISGKQVNGVSVTNSLGHATNYWYLKSSANGYAPVVYQTGPTACPSCMGSGSQGSGYDLSGNKLTEIDFNGNLTVWRGYNLTGDYAAETTAYGSPYSNTTQYTWNTTLHQPTSITTKSVLGSGNKVTYNNYNSTNELLSITQTGYTFDSSGNITPYAYTTFYSYDNFGDLNGMKDANGNVTIYNRDSMGNISDIINALNQTTYYSNYDNMGHAGTVTDPNGNVSNITYNWRGQVTFITQKGASSTGTDLTTGFSYDVKGNLSKVTYPSGAYTAYTYDAADHVTSIIRYNGSAQAFGAIVYTYDTEGNKLSEKVYDTRNNLVRYKNYTYDQYNRLAQLVNGITATTTYGYDGNGNMVIQTDPNGNITNYQYNALNKLSQVIQYISSTNAQTAYLYNL